MLHETPAEPPVEITEVSPLVSTEENSLVLKYDTRIVPAYDTNVVPELDTSQPPEEGIHFEAIPDTCDRESDDRSLSAQTVISVNKQSDEVTDEPLHDSQIVDQSDYETPDDDQRVTLEDLPAEEKTSILQEVQSDIESESTLESCDIEEKPLLRRKGKH